MEENEQERIFGDWMARQRGVLFKVVRAYAFTPYDQDDLFQEIAVQVWKSIPGFRGESSPATWIYRVSLYSAIAWSKRERRHREGSEPIADVEHTLTETSRPRDDRLEWLYGQIAQLDEIDRSLTLLLLEGFSYKEMSSILGISESNVGVKIHRIKKRLTDATKEGSRWTLKNSR